MKPGAPDIFDVPARYEGALEGFRLAGVLQVTAFHGTLTLLAWGLGRWLPDTVPPHGGQFELPVAALAAQVPLMALAGHLFRLRRRRAFHFVHALLSVANFTWLGALAWAGPSFLSAVLISLFVLWAYHDAWVSGSTDARAVYLVAAPAADLALLALDASGGRGLVWAWGQERSSVLAFLTLQVALTGLVQWMIAWVAAEVQARDAAVARQASLEQQLALMRRERETIQATTSILATGLLASKVSHDLANPTAVLRLELDALERLRARLPGHAERAEVDEVVAGLREAVGQVVSLAGGLTAAVRAAETVAPRSVGSLVAEAVERTLAAVRSHAADACPVRVDVEEAEVVVASGHVGTLANILTNCSLYSGRAGIDVSGGPEGSYFYRLCIRDHGVEGEAREEALDRIAALLSLGPQATPPPRGAGYRGIGIALVLAKLYVLRYNGALAVRAPPSGPGLQFLVVLPTRPPASIPDQHNHPEQIANQPGVTP